MKKVAAKSVKPQKCDDYITEITNFENTTKHTIVQKHKAAAVKVDENGTISVIDSRTPFVSANGDAS